MYTTLKEAGASKNKEEKGQALHGKTGQRNEKFTEIEIHTVLKHIKKRCANSLIQKKNAKENDTEETLLIYQVFNNKKLQHMY